MCVLHATDCRKNCSGRCSDRLQRWWRREFTMQRLRTIRSWLICVKSSVNAMHLVYLSEVWHSNRVTHLLSWADVHFTNFPRVSSGWRYKAARNDANYVTHGQSDYHGMLGLLWTAVPAGLSSMSCSSSWLQVVIFFRARARHCVQAQPCPSV